MGRPIIVFDLDETIGYFQQLSVFIYALEEVLKKKVSQNELLQLLDLYQEYFRPGIFKIFKYIEKNQGFEECLRVRETHSDESFLKNYLNEELCKELNLFSYSFHQKDGYNRITEVSGEDTWRTVRDDLIKSVGLNSIPVVMVKELLRDGTLVLQHEHDGRDLELSEANKVFEHINELWNGEVKFTTIIEEETWEF